MAEATFATYNNIPLTNPGAYTTGQAIGTTITLAGLGTGGGILDSVRLTDVGQSGAVDVVIYRSAPTSPAGDRTTFAGATDRKLVLGVVNLLAANYDALGSGAGMCAAASKLPIQYTATQDGNLYAQLVARGSITYATNDLVLQCGRSF